MVNQDMDKSSQHDCKLIHIQVIDGSEADIYEVGKAFKKFKETLPYRIEAIVTNDHIKLSNVDDMIRELFKLKKLIDKEKKTKENET